MVRFIGDVHGHYDAYLELIKDQKTSIQVGDMGLGFKIPPTIPPGHGFIRGNHDNPQLCKDHPNWIPDASFDGKIFYLGGAFSIDHERRVEGVTKWHDEELSISELYEAMDKYELYRPSVVVSHDGPLSVTNRLFLGSSRTNNRTAQALDSLLYIYQPKLWVFGHWHTNVDVEMNGTRFVCINKIHDLEDGEVGYKDIDLDAY